MSEPVITKRSGGKLELIGTLIILASMGGCSALMVGGSEVPGFMTGTAGCLAGLITFLAGRFS